MDDSTVMLSEAKHLTAHRDRPFAALRACPERSEGPVALGSEMLRCAQHDRIVTQTDSWINVFNCIIGTYG
jgi:hypothetical protein